MGNFIFKKVLLKQLSSLISIQKSKTNIQAAFNHELGRCAFGKTRGSCEGRRQDRYSKKNQLGDPFIVKLVEFKEEFSCSSNPKNTLNRTLPGAFLF